MLHYYKNRPTLTYKCVSIGKKPLNILFLMHHILYCSNHKEIPCISTTWFYVCTVQSWLTENRHVWLLILLLLLCMGQFSDFGQGGCSGKYSKLSYTLLENLTLSYCLAVGDKMFDHLSLFDETVRHIELCNSVISHIQLNLAKLF